MALWVADEGGHLLRQDADQRLKLCAQPLCLTACSDCVICAACDGAHVYAADTAKELHRYPLPPGVNRLCALPDALFCLSSEADSVSLLCPQTGRLRLCAQAGCYPRDMKISPCGRYVAVAGGAAGTLTLLSSRSLTPLRQIMLPGVVCAAAFLPSGMAALCAVGESDVTSQLYRLSPRGVISEVMRCPGLPGALAALPDHTLLLGALGELLRLRPDGRILQRIPCGLPAALRVYPAFSLAADPLSGQVLRLAHTIGKSAAVCCCSASPNDMLLI